MNIANSIGRQDCDVTKNTPAVKIAEFVIEIMLPRQNLIVPWALAVFMVWRKESIIIALSILGKYCLI